jgi:hypothetical protein
VKGAAQPRNRLFERHRTVRTPGPRRAAGHVCRRTNHAQHYLTRQNPSSACPWP